MPSGIYKRTPDMNTGKYKRTQETKENTSAAAKGRVPWNKGLTKETDKRVAKSGKKNSNTKKGRLRIPRETRTCLCGCKETFICKENSKQRFIKDHYIRTIKAKTNLATIKKDKTWEELYGVETAAEMRENLIFSYLGNHRSKKTKEKIRTTLKDHVVSKETRDKIGKANSLIPHARGEKSNNWRGGITSLAKLIRALLEYKQWRTIVFQRDGYTCQNCNKRGGYLEAHHSGKSFSDLLQEFLKEYDQFSPFEDKDTLVRLAMKWEPFWNAKGETLCKKCHDLTKLGKETKRMR